ncbi:MAG: hypothetical protein FWF41_06390 [Betaproteobacteria bacterium]|nr:hypothetical protein [Betaproteobacteria bacterium]
MPFPSPTLQTTSALGIPLAFVAVRANYTHAARFARVNEVAAKINASDATAETLASTIDTIKSTNTIKRDPAAIKQYLEEVTNGSPAQQLYIDANTLKQTGLTEPLVRAIPALREQVAIAEGTRGDISINASDFMTQAALNPSLEPLVELLKSDPDGFSRAEKKAYLQSGLEADVNGAVEKQLTETAQAIKADAPRVEIHNAIKSELDELGRFDPKVNDAYANVASRWYAAKGERLGLTPQEMRERYPLKTVAEGIVDQGKLSQKVSDEFSDKRYFDALEAGDMETAQRIVDHRASQAGYVSTDEYRMNHRAPSSHDADATVSLSNLKDNKIVPSDYWEKPEWYQYGFEEHSSFYKIKSALDSKANRVWMYRAVPKNVKENGFRNGDWIAPTREYAEREGKMIPGGYRIIAERVNKNHVWWDANSIGEFGFDDGKNYVYKNTKNNRKLNDVVVKDANGNVVPPSKRFNYKAYEPYYQRSAQTRADFENRIADLYAGAAPNKEGVRALDEGDVLTITGHGNMPVVINESHAVDDGKYNHGMTAADWKKVPDWLDNPVAVFERASDGNLMMIAPEKKNGRAIVMGLEPSSGETGRVSGEGKRHLVLTVYPKDAGTLNLLSKIERGDYKPIYVDQKRNSPKFYGEDSGIRFPGSAAELRATNRSIKTDSDLVKYRKARDSQAFHQIGWHDIPEKIDVDGTQRHTMNSEGRPIANSEEELRNFWRWFGDSKAVDDTGRPLVVYHGTNADFSTFNPYLIGSNTGALWSGTGFYFSRSIHGALDSSANWYGDTVYHVFLNIKKPFIVPKDDVELGRAIVAIDKNAKTRNGEKIIDRLKNGDQILLRDVSGLTELLRNNGFDGVINGAEYVAFRPEQIKSATGNRGSFDPNDPNILHQRAWHGSPHEFYRFMLAHIGTGEGAQAYGWGMYFAGNKEIADYYRKSLSRWRAEDEQRLYTEAKNYAEDTIHYSDGDEKEAVKGLLKDADFRRHSWGDETGARMVEQAARWIEEGKPDFVPSKEGKLYEVNIPEDHELLDWDKPLAEQPENARTAIQPLIAQLKKSSPGFDTDTATGKGFYLAYSKHRGGNDEAASKALNEAGVKGIRYLDGFSRRKGEGSHNYVIFDDKSIEMLNRFYQSSTGDAHQIVERATPERQAATLDEAREQAGAFVGKEVTNDETGFVGVVSKTNLGKMTSESAVSKSVSLESHTLAVANADKLFRHATLDHSHPDVKGELTIAAIHRFVAPMMMPNGEVLAVKFTAKETTSEKNPNPIYSIETLDVEKPVRMAPDESGIERAIGSDAVATHPTDGLVGNVADMVDRVKRAKDTLNQSQDTIRGSFDPRTLTIALGKNANASTYLHETGHFWLEAQSDIANRLTAESRDRELTQGETQELADMYATLDWFGVQDLNTWNALPFEEKRSYHEKFAEAAEKYFYEGVSPSVEMRGVFQRFRDWLLQVYHNHVSGDLPDSIKQVFDRMLATDAEIKVAQEVRRMEPMFRTVEEAGVSPEEFGAYLGDLHAATSDATEELQGRSLRDLRWLHNARGREVERLQKEAASLRRMVQTGVRSEVMSEPVYQAWGFLTRRLDNQEWEFPDAPEAVKGKPGNAVDESRDSMFMAIAKLGGMDLTQARGEWGVTDKIPMPLFGKPVLRREGGRMLDEMAQALAERGYLPTDEHGKVDLHEFESAFHDELIGSQRFSTAYDYRNAVQPEGAPEPRPLLVGRLDIGALREMYGGWDKNDPSAKASAIIGMPTRKVAFRSHLTKKAAEDMVRGFGEMQNQHDGRIVTMPISTVGKISGHKGFDVTTVIHEIPELFKTSLHGWSENETTRDGHKEHHNIKDYHQYVNKFTSEDGQEYFIRFTVAQRKAKGGKDGDSHIHSTAVSDIKIDKNGDVQQSVRGSNPVLSEHTPFSDKKLQDFLGSVKSKGQANSASGYDPMMVRLLEDRRMTAAAENGGLHPDVAAEILRPLTGFDSGDALVRALAEARHPSAVIEDLTDARMLEQHGDLATPDAIQRAADEAVHNEARARAVATEAAMLDRALGKTSLARAAAKDFAEKVVSRTKRGVDWETILRGNCCRQNFR